MDIFVTLLLSLSLLLIGSLVGLTLLTLRVARTWQLRMLRAQATNELRMKSLVTSLTTAMLQQEKEQTKRQQQLVSLADKGMALAKAGDALAYQAIQSMEPLPTGYDAGDFDPSEKAEIERIARRNPDLQEDDLSGFEKGILGDIGIEPEFIFGRDPDEARPH